MSTDEIAALNAGLNSVGLRLEKVESTCGDLKSQLLQMQGESRDGRAVLAQMLADRLKREDDRSDLTAKLAVSNAEAANVERRERNAFILKTVGAIVASLLTIAGSAAAAYFAAHGGS